MKRSYNAMTSSLYSQAMAKLDNVKVKQGVKPQFGDLSQIGKTMENVGTLANHLEDVNKMMSQMREVCDRVKSVMKVQDDDSVVEAVVSRLEALVLLVWDLSSRSALQEMIAPMMLYLKTWAPNKSFFRKVSELLLSILSEDAHGEQVFYRQSGWFESNWLSLVEGHFGKRLAGAINLLICVGILPEKSSHLLTNELFKAIHVQSLRKTHPSVLHHLFGTLDWMVDSVIPALVTQNMSLLLFDSDALAIDDMYRSCLDIVSLSVSGQMERVKEKYGLKDEAEIVVYLTNTAGAHWAVKSKCRDDKRLQAEMQTRVIKLDKLMNDITAYWHQHGMRTKPFAVLIRGPSGVGKSTLAGLSCHAICRSNNFAEGEEFQVTMNGNDKYQSEFRSQHVCVIFDDVGNTKPERCEGNPLFTLIQFINNMHCAALSPEAEKKGKNDIRSKVVVVTTNTSDLHSSFFSVNPSSVMRRFDLVIDAQLKAGASSDTGGLHKKFAGQAQPDAWDLRLSEIHIIRNKQDVLADTWEERLLLETDVVGLIDYLGSVTPSFFETQQKLVEASSDLHKKPHCPVHDLFTLPCVKCGGGEYGFEPCETVQEEDPAQKAYMKQVGLVFSREAQERFLRDFHDEEFFSSNESIVSQVSEVCEDSPVDRVKKICSSSFESLKYHLGKTKETVEKEPWLVAVGVFSTVCLAAFGIHSLFQPKTYKGEGALLQRIAMAARSPQTLVEKDNKYQKVYSNNIQFPKGSVSTTLQQLERKIDKNLFVVTVYELYNDGSRGTPTWSNAFPIGGSRWVMVGHQCEPDKDYYAEFRCHPGVGIKKFNAMLNNDNLRWLEGTDVVVADLPQGGDAADFTKYMFETKDQIDVAQGAPLFVYHVHRQMTNCSPEEYRVPSSYMLSTTFGQRKNLPMDYPDGKVYLPGFTYEGDNHFGMCGSMIFVAGRNPILLGMHVAGIPEDRDCGGVFLSQDMFSKVPGFNLAEENDLPESIFGRSINLSEVVHPYHPVHYIESPEHNIQVFGMHDQPLARFRSDVIKSPIAEAMEEKMGYTPTHGAPQKKSARPSRRRHMLKASEILPVSNPTYLKAAAQDLAAKLAPLIDQEKFRELVHPLSYEDAINGIPGVKGFDPVNPKTSMGWPLNCPKHRCFVECALRDELGLETTKFVKRSEVNGRVTYEYEIKFDPAKADVEAETEKILDWFVNGKRASVVFRSNLKDEPVTFKKIAEDKIRIFSGAPVALVVVGRMLTLPLINLMTYFPFEFESAVGIDATGKDWDYVYNKFAEFGSERCGDGDFKSYDQSVRPEFTQAAFGIIRSILEKCGFEPDMLAMFDGFATECIHPIYESDGVVYKVNGSNPSGHSLTVIINGIINSLYMRYAYYAMHRARFGKIPLFHLMVLLLTYGDDHIFSVSDKEREFNMMSVAIELEKIGIIYTSADKEASEVMFKPLNQLSFLKRVFNLHPVLKKRVGALELASLWKSIYLARRPKKGQQETVAEICAGNVRGVLRELYFHSPDLMKHYQPILEDVMIGCVDNDGHRVLDYYRPFTEEEITEMYDSTWCAYGEAQKIMYRQSGVVDEHPPEFSGVGIYEECPLFISADNEDEFFEQVIAFDQRHGLYWEDLYEVYEDGVLLLPPDTVYRINFRRYLCIGGSESRMFSELLCDCRHHMNGLYDAVIERQERACRRSAINTYVGHLWKYCRSVHALAKDDDENAVRLMRRLQRSWLGEIVNDDIDSRIWSFFENSMDDQAMTRTLQQHLAIILFVENMETLIHSTAVFNVGLEHMVIW